MPTTGAGRVGGMTGGGGGGTGAPAPVWGGGGGGGAEPPVGGRGRGGDVGWWPLGPGRERGERGAGRGQTAGCLPFSWRLAAALDAANCWKLAKAASRTAC